MRTQRGPGGQFSSLYGTTTLRLRPDFPYPSGGARYERRVFDANDQLIVPLNEWYLLMKGIGADRTRETYLAMVWLPDQARLSMECATGGGTRVHPVVPAGGRLRAPTWPSRGAGSSRRPTDRRSAPTDCIC
jgi:hypothetical protein